MSTRAVRSMGAAGGVPDRDRPPEFTRRYALGARLAEITLAVAIVAAVALVW